MHSTAGGAKPRLGRRRTGGGGGMARLPIEPWKHGTPSVSGDGHAAKWRDGDGAFAHITLRPKKKKKKVRVPSLKRNALTVRAAPVTCPSASADVFQGNKRAGAGSLSRHSSHTGAWDASACVQTRRDNAALVNHTAKNGGWYPIFFFLCYDPGMSLYQIRPLAVSGYGKMLRLNVYRQQRGCDRGKDLF